MIANAGDDQEGLPSVTVFIPTYNRADLLPRALQSVVDQNYPAFDVLIVDDGSTDDTRNVVERFRESYDGTVVYVYKVNGGKHTAYNTALAHLASDFTVMLDSDDALAPYALTRLVETWHAIPHEHRDQFCGVEGLCAHLGDGQIAGGRFPEDTFDSDYISLRCRLRVGGDKKNLIRTDVLKRFPYPVFEGERHIRPSLVWKRMAHQYLTRHINEVVQLIEYQPGGLSADRPGLRARNPQGYRYYYREDLDCHQPLARGRWDSAVKYVRYSFHAGVGMRQQAREVGRKRYWAAALLVGWLKYVRDRRAR